MEKVCVIVGPTGVGKTSLSVPLASTFNASIVSGDSMQVYKEMSIGTAKIKESEMCDITHYLIDQFSFQEEYNVKSFQSLSRTYIKTIRQEGKLPMICGGTGLYIKSALYDYQFLEQTQDQAFMDFLQHRSADELWSLLRIVDPKVCETIHQNNRQRIVRALYMAHVGEKKSDVIEAQNHKPMYDCFIIGLTMNRDGLYARINKRVDQMMDEGLLEEISNLVKQHEHVWELQSFQGIGYKEWKAYFDGEASINECVENIKKNSRNFAKRQYTWFRNQMDVHWYDIEDARYPNNVYEDVKAWLEN